MERSCAHGSAISSTATAHIHAKSCRNWPPKGAYDTLGLSHLNPEGIDMTRLRTALIATVALALALCGAAAQADSGALKQKVDAVIDQAIAENRIVGAVVLV